MGAERDRLADVARAAVGAGDWARAHRAYQSLVERDATAEALLGLGDTLWWLGETVAAIRQLERAYAAFRRRSDADQSAMTAIGLYLINRVSLGRTEVARGWLARAHRLADLSTSPPVPGWVALMRGHDSEDPVAAERFAADARQAGAAVGEPTSNSAR